MINIDNINILLGDDLRKNLNSESKVKICAAYFSIYAFDELRKELSNIKEFQFLYHSPTFLHKEITNKKQKEFYIPPFVREKYVSGGEFEIKLRNELSQKAIARECRKWIEQKAKFKSLNDFSGTNNGIFISNKKENLVYLNIDKFTVDGLGYQNNNNKTPLLYPKLEGPSAKEFIRVFDQIWKDDKLSRDVTDKVINYISSLHKENSPEYIYFITLYNIFSEFLEDISSDNFANEKTGFMDTTIWKILYNFQKDSVLGGINKLEKYNGCILADSVGLGKTFTALGIIKYYELRNKNVLVLCPKRLSENWNTFVSNYKTNILIEDRFSYDVLYHTDLLREKGKSNGIDLSKINWANYDLIVIDESHNFRNNTARNRYTRYQKLMDDVIKKGVKTKILMLSATPVNNRFGDLRNQLALAYEGDSSKLNIHLKSNRDVENIFREAERIFKKWSELSHEHRTTTSLLDSLSYDFFEVLDSVTIARSRKHITNYYDMKDIGIFPKKNKPINQDFVLTDIEGFLSYKDIFETLSKLNLEFYSPSKYILPQKRAEYESKYDTIMSNSLVLKQTSREKGIIYLMRINLLKRLESSIFSFKKTLDKLNNNLINALDVIESYKNKEKNLLDIDFPDLQEGEEISDDLYVIGKAIKINLEDMDFLSWEREIRRDQEIISDLIEEMNKINVEDDTKLRDLINLIENKINNPINDNNKKVVVFSAFSDTVDYLYKNVSEYFLNKYNLHSASITGSGGCDTTLKLKNKDMDILLTYFSPISKQRDNLDIGDYNIDLLFGTDCISEGQNLQDCDYLINYDIHWNPVKIIQRFGRIDRIGSINKKIQLVNYWPPLELDEYIKLKSKVYGRMSGVNIAAGGEDSLISEEDKIDLEYRKVQLSKLKNEVIELEDVGNSISITDLGLNEFRMDLVNYYKEKGEIMNVPFGLHSIVQSNNIYPPGVIFVLKNLNRGVNINNVNRLHPFYLVYVKEDGNVYSNHIDVKKLLDIYRVLSKNKGDPDFKLCEIFNKETDDGSNMIKYSKLLNKAIESIINVKKDQDVNSLFKPGGTSIGLNEIKGLEDFELVTFMVIK